MTVEFLKRTAKRVAPDLYWELQNTRDKVVNKLFYPKIENISVGDVNYTMLVGSRHENAVVKGRYFENEVILTMLDQIQPGDVVANVGAATGTHAIPWAIKTGQGGIVYAFEPDPGNFNRLETNIKLNNVENIVPLQVALLDQDGEKTLLTEGVAGQAPYLQREDNVSFLQKKLKNRIPVLGRRLDTLVGDGIISEPALVNIDVEGSGLEVLLGMGELRPRGVLLEVHPHLGEDIDLICELMISRGYEDAYMNPTLQIEGGKTREEIHVYFNLQ